MLRTTKKDEFVRRNACHVRFSIYFKQGAGMLHTGRSFALQEISIALVQMKVVHRICRNVWLI